jgi:hypothetical protein
VSRILLEQHSALWNTRACPALPGCGPATAVPSSAEEQSAIRIFRAFPDFLEIWAGHRRNLPESTEGKT